MAKRCQILPGKPDCSRPNLFQQGYLGIGPFQSGFLSETQAFIDAVEDAGGTLTEDEKNAINTYVADAIGNADAWWDDLKAFWPFVGSSMEAHQINLKTPGTFDLTFVNTVAGDHTATGWTPNGIDSIARTGLIPNNELTTISGTYGYYSRDNTAENAAEMGAGSMAPASITILFVRWNGLNQTLWDYDQPVRLAVVNARSDGYLLGSRIASNDVRIFKNGVQLGATGVAAFLAANPPTVELYLGAENNNGVAQTFSSKETAGVVVANGLTTAQALAEYTALQTLNTTLSRQV